MQDGDRAKNQEDFKEEILKTTWQTDVAMIYSGLNNTVQMYIKITKLKAHMDNIKNIFIFYIIKKTIQAAT